MNTVHHHFHFLPSLLKIPFLSMSFYFSRNSISYKVGSDTKSASPRIRRYCVNRKRKQKNLLLFGHCRLGTVKDDDKANMVSMQDLLRSVRLPQLQNGKVRELLVWDLMLFFRNITKLSIYNSIGYMKIRSNSIFT